MLNRGSFCVPFAALLIACGPSLPTVSFAVAVPSTTPDGTQLFVSGNRPELGSMHGGGLALTRGNDGLYHGNVSLPAGVSLYYRVTRGGSATGEQGAFGVDV